jgi:hypothetical protein
VAVDRVDDSSQDHVKRFTLKGVVEVTDREVVGHPEFGYVRRHDLNVPASVLMTPRRHSGTSDFGQDGRDLDADDPAEGPSCGLVDNSTFSTSEIDKSVVIRDPEIAERSWEHMPGRWQVRDPIRMGVLGLEGVA